MGQQFDDYGGQDQPPDPTAGLGASPSIAGYGPGMGPGMTGGYYGDAAAYQTQLRAGYGNSPLFAMQGIGAVAGGMYAGGQNMLTTIGSHIRPLSYTPPAYIATGFSGRYIQQTGIMNDLRNMLGVGPSLRGARDYDIGRGAAADMGERMGLGLGGAGLAVGETAVGTVAGMALGTIPGFAAFYAAGKYTEKVREAVAERRHIENYLDITSDRFITAGAAPGMIDPRRGAGMSIRAREEAANFLRGMDVKDPLLNTRDLTGILKGSVEAGLFTGTHDMDEFKKRFKDIVENVKVVATTLHQTLEEGVKTIKDLRGIGINPTEARNVVMNAEALGRVAGRSASEMMSLGMQGAELFRGTGVDMKVGFEANQMNLAAIRSSRDAKMLSDEAVAQAGGEEALSQRMTATGLSFAQSGMGRGLSGAFFNAGAGPGGFDAAAFNAFVSGSADIGQVGMAAARGLGSPRKMIEFQANQAKFASALGAQAGGQGFDVEMLRAATATAQTISRVTGASMEDATKSTLMTQMGLDDTTATALMAKMRNAQGTFDAAQGSADQTRQQQSIQEASQNFLLTRLQGEVGGFLKGALLDPVARPLDHLTNVVQEGALSFHDRQLYGIERYNLGTSAAASFTGASTGAERAAILADPTARTNALGEVIHRDIDLNTGGLFAATPGSDLHKLMGRDSLFNFEKGGDVIVRRGRSLLTAGLLETDAGTERTSSASLRENAKLAGVLSRTVMQAEAAEAKDKEAGGAIKDARVKVKEVILNAMARREEVTDIREVAQKAFGKDLKQLQPGGAEYDALLLETKTLQPLKEQTEQAQKDSQVALAADRRMDLMMTVNDLAAADEAKDRVRAELRTGVGRTLHVGGPDLSNAATAALAKVAERYAKVTHDGRRPGVRSPAEAEADSAAEDVFRKELYKVGGDEGRELMAHSEEYLEKARKDSGTQKELLEFSQVYHAIDAEQQIRGQKILRMAVVDQLPAGMDQKDKDKIISVVDKIGQEGAGALAQLDKGELKLLGSTAAGGLLQKEAGVAAFLSKAGATGTKVSEADLTAQGIAQPQAAEISAAFSRGGAVQGTEVLHAGSLSLLAGQTGASTAGAAAGVGTAAGTAQDSYAIQTSMNLQTLALFKALAAKVYGVH